MIESVPSVFHTSTVSTAAALDTTRTRSPRLAALAEHDIAFGDDRSPLARVVERCGDDATVRCVARRHAVQLAGVEEERRLRLDSADHVAPLARRRVEQFGVDPSPSDQHVHQQVPTVVAGQHVGPGLRRREVVEHQRVVGRIRAEAMEEDVTVVLVVWRIAEVPEPGVVGQPGDRGGAGVRDRVRELLAGGDLDHRQRALFGATLAETDCDQRTIGRRLVPVDGDGSVGGAVGWVEQRPSSVRRGRRPIARPARTDRRRPPVRGRTACRRAPPRCRPWAGP